MKNHSTLYFISALILFVLFIPSGAFAGQKMAEFLGEPEMCIDVDRIKETRIIDNQTILFIMRGGTRYLNRLPVPCTGLVLGNGFAYSTSISRLCLQDSIEVLNTGSALGGTCPLGKFLPFKADMKDSAAVKLLKDGLLDELVAEGAFEGVFESEK